MLFRHLGGILRVGFKEYIKQVWFLREFRGGILVGKDEFGNAYYEVSKVDPTIPFYRERYVLLANGDDSSKVPPDWHGWLHYTNDDAPSRSKVYVYPSWGIPQTGNLTGTNARYIPYSTTVRKIVPYSPPNLETSRAFTLANPAVPRNDVTSRGELPAKR